MDKWRWLLAYSTLSGGSRLCTAACSRGSKVHSCLCHTVPEKGGVKYVVCIVSEFCQAAVEILIAASALSVLQGGDGPGMHTLIFRYIVHKRLLYPPFLGCTPGLN